MIKLSLEESSQRVIRRSELVNLIKQQHAGKQGAVLFFASFEKAREAFYQDSTFFYYVGLNAPAVIVYQSLDQSESVLYEPNYSIDPTIWVTPTYTQKTLDQVGLTKTAFLGDKIAGYSMNLFGDVACTHKNFIELCKKSVASVSGYLFIVIEDASDDCRALMAQIFDAADIDRERIIDISSLSATLRRKKDSQEIGALYKAIEVTLIAHEAAAGVIRPGAHESDAHAAINYIFTEGKMVPAFTSIVGSGKNSTVLHYTCNDAKLEQGDLVVVDIGAAHKHYCADISRTYPVSGVFTQRQKEVYDIVLKTQEYISALAKPGMWLNNANNKEKSLHHLAQEFLTEHGYGQYFPHGIGHFVGLDVHDVGDRSIPLAVGDVITIEPGIYIPEERLGVRIEDMYWIVDGEAICLSDGFPKSTIEIEELMRQSEIKQDPKEGQERSSKVDQNLFLS